MKTEATLCYFLLIPSALLLIASISAADMPEGALHLRDDPSYFQLVHGIRDSKRARPTEENIENLVSKAEGVYRDYLRELFKGFIAEGRGDLIKASQHYKNCLSIPVHEEQSYYTNFDLARISLKLGKTKDATDYLQQYLRYVDQEIRAGEGQLTEIFFGYVPSGEALTFMKKEYQRLSIIVESMKRASEQ